MPTSTEHSTMKQPGDNDTRELDLEEAKRRRGRPVTGTAMTNAERQRAYRQRAKTQRNEKSEVGTDLVSRAKYEELHAITIEISDRCALAEHRRDELHDQVQKLLEQRDSLIRECHELKKELALRHGKEMFQIESCEKGKRTWKTIGGSIEPMAKELAEICLKDLQKGETAKGFKYRIVPTKTQRNGK